MQAACVLRQGGLIVLRELRLDKFAGFNPGLISGPVGSLEVAVTVPAELKVPVVTVICPPDPVAGGTMSNKVVTTVARTCRQLGMMAVRFNYRGVGLSTGVFDHGIGESDDLRAVLDWVQKEQPEARLWLVGFSFGAYVAQRVACFYPLEWLVSIAPAVSLRPFDQLSPPHCPWLIIQGERDEIVAFEAVRQWASTQPAELIVLPEAGHFFHGQLLALQAALKTHLMPSNK